MADRSAPVDYEVHDLIRERWSPRAFADRAVSPAELRRLFEAARWAASCANAQPWAFVYAHRANAAAFAVLLDCLNPGNQSWAQRAAVLIISAARRDFVSPGKPNRANAHAFHDVGLAVGQLGLQATAMGLGIHQMAGFNRDKARVSLGIPEGHEPVTAIALGYPGDPAQLPDELRAREQAPRQRLPQAEFAFEGRWPAS
jgi:nitroreductase